MRGKYLKDSGWVWLDKNVTSYSEILAVIQVAHILFLHFFEKNFEQLQGRADSKTAFYAALSNSLGGDDANVFVKEAATWFYSLQHSPTPSGYNVFSRALENATR